MVIWANKIAAGWHERLSTPANHRSVNWRVLGRVAGVLEMSTVCAAIARCPKLDVLVRLRQQTKQRQSSRRNRYLDRILTCIFPVSFGGERRPVKNEKRSGCPSAFFCSDSDYPYSIHGLGGLS